MSDSEFQQMLDASLRRRLTSAEQSRLQEHFERDPGARRRWEDEAGLTRMLADLPDAALPSNFTALVLQAVDRDAQTRRHSADFFRWFRGIRPVHGAVWVCALMATAGLSYQQYHALARARMAASLASITSGVESAAIVAQLPPAELWQDFEPISRLPDSRVGHAGFGADEELLAALK